ncbi:MAG: hypothetical protein HFI34_08380 [Lachnospiraceae bacterium]|nr:hypothetical protein [Lachnospiraceae bacterium]
MMKNLIIVGNGTYAKMMKKYIDMTLFGQVLSYVADKEFIYETELDGINVISFEELFERFSEKEITLIMGIGYTQMSNLRKKIFERCKERGYRFENYIHPTAIIAPDAKIGEGNNILETVIIEAGVSIGNGNLFYGGVIIGHDSSVGDYNTFSVKAVTAGFVTIKNNCFLGVASAVKNDIIINDYSMIGAMACGYKDMAEYSVVVPARSEVLQHKKSTDCHL